jgi:aspartate kinase
MPTLVQKYGGSSLATVAKVEHVARRVAAAHRAGNAVVVVVSARGATTDRLLDLASRVSRVRPDRELDQLLATGECASAALLALALAGIGVPAVSLTGAQAGVSTTGPHGRGTVAALHPERVLHLLADGNVVVVAGFQGVNAAGDVVTLGRGGSDTTAVALAARLAADGCAIYTDVDGVYTADPRAVPDARVQPTVDVRVMAEMAAAGARVLHPRSVQLAQARGVAVHVGNACAAEPGTLITVAGFESHGAVVGVAHDLDVAQVLLRGPGGRQGAGAPAADVLAALASHAVPADLVGQDGSRIGFTVRRADLPRVHRDLRRLGRITVDQNVGKVSVVGTGLLDRPEYPARMAAALAKAGITTPWLAASQLRISVTTRLDRAVDAVRVLHREFELAA